MWTIAMAISVLLNVVMFIISIIIGRRHLQAKKFEFLFLVIMFTLPVAFGLNNAFQIYTYWIDGEGESVITDFKKFDSYKLRTFLRWYPLLLLFTISSAYFWRTISYYVIVRDFEYVSKTWHRRFYYSLFLVVNLGVNAIFFIRLAAGQEQLSLYFLISSGILFVLCGIGCLIAPFKFLARMKMKYPHLYYSHRRIITIFWISLSISMMWRGITMIMSFMYNTCWTSSKFRSATLLVINITNFNEFVPAIALYILLCKNLDRPFKSFDTWSSDYLLSLKDPNTQRFTLDNSHCDSDEESEQRNLHESSSVDLEQDQNNTQNGSTFKSKSHVLSILFFSR